MRLRRREGKDVLTVSFEGLSASFLPTSLLVHSSVLSPELEVIPGTTRGILAVFVLGFWDIGLK